MKRRLIIFLILSVLILIFSKPAFAQYGNETITITTYYPSPHGVYGVLTLYPSDSQPDPAITREGDLYYDKGTEDPTNRPKGVYVYNGSVWTRTSMGGGGGGGGTAPIKLATPLLEQVGEPLPIPPASVTSPMPECIKNIKGSCSGFGAWTQIGSYSFNVDRSGIKADIKQSVYFDSTNQFESVCGISGGCTCCKARMIFDGEIVDEGRSFDYTSPDLIIGQHSVSFEFRPKKCHDAVLDQCSCNIAEIRNGIITLSRSVSEILVPDSAYK